MIEILEQKLQNLYLQKSKIEQEISLLQKKIKEQTKVIRKTLSKDEKIELFKELFIVLLNGINDSGFLILEAVVSLTSLIVSFNFI